MRFPRNVLVAAAAIFALATGCGKQYDLAEVSGKVTIDGQPVTFGTVLFIPDRGIAASGAIQPDGTYRLTTVGHGDGAIVGRHKICILPPNPLDQMGSLPTGPIDGPNTGDPSAGGPSDAAPPKVPSTIPQRYQIVETSGLSADVIAGDNVCDFPLVAKAPR